MRARQTIKIDAATPGRRPRGYDQFVSAGFGLWLDYDWRKNGWNARPIPRATTSPLRLGDQPPRGDRAIRRICLDLHRDAPLVVRERTVDLPLPYVETVRSVRRALAGG